MKKLLFFRNYSMKRTLFCIVALNFSLLNVSAQLQKAEIAVGGAAYDTGFSIIQQSNGGYTMAGLTDSYAYGGSGIPAAYIVNLNSSGSLNWTRTICSNTSADASCIIQTEDQNYVISGYGNFDNGYGNTAGVFKLDTAGNIKWAKSIHGTSSSKSEYGYSIIQAKDGDYVTVGKTTLGEGKFDVYVVKLDTAGNIRWTRTIGGDSVDIGYSLVQSKDNGYVIAGKTNSYGAGNYDVYIVKLDSAGNLKWTRTVGGAGDDEGYSVTASTDGGFVIAGKTNSYGAGNYDVYVVKLDSVGNLQWTKTVGGTGDDEGYSVRSTTDGGYVIAGRTNSYGAGNYDAYIIKLDLSGNLKWTRVIGGPADDEGISVIQTNDRGYAIGGYTNSYGAGHADMYMIKLDSTGNTCLPADSGGITSSGGVSATGGIANSGGSVGNVGIFGSGGILTDVCSTITSNIEIPTLVNNVEVYPNPSNGIFSVKIETAETTDKSAIEVYNMLGEKVYSSAYKTQHSIFVIDLNSQPSGIYLYRVIGETGNFVSEGKFIIQK